MFFVKNFNMYLGSIWIGYQAILIFNNKKMKWRAAFSSILLFTLLTSINMLLITSSFQINVNKYFSFCFLVLVFLINYSVFVHKKKYEIIDKKYEDLSLIKKILCSLILILEFICLVGFIIIEYYSF